MTAFLLYRLWDVSEKAGTMYEQQNNDPGSDQWAQWRRSIVVRPPVNVLTHCIPYDFAHAVFVPCEPGVYLISDLRGVLYVGKTKNLAGRYRQHFWGSHNDLLNTALLQPVGVLQFGWVLCDETEMDHQERFLIRTFQPICNSVRYTT